MESGVVHVYAEPVTLPPLIERALNLVREDATRHVFSSVASDTLPLVAADPRKTEFILLNLLRGAIERCPGGGHIAVEVKARIPEVIVSVEDDGEPISTHQLDKIFWQFYPADGDEGKVPSTYHLGLYTTKRLVELQGGRVWAQSQPGHGSRFSFSLPVWG
jgi:signal transduction histidine kinase